VLKSGENALAPSEPRSGILRTRKSEKIKQGMKLAAKRNLLFITMAIGLVMMAILLMSPMPEKSASSQPVPNPTR